MVRKIRWWVFLIVIPLLMATNCKGPDATKFNHSRTLFPLTGTHKGVLCRDCHRDGTLTSLPTQCDSCHPMSIVHTQGLGDCNLCHTTSTFSAAYFNHRKAGIPMKGKHLTLVGQNCFACHTKPVYSGIPFVCSNCHTYSIGDTWVHTSPVSNCDACHTQFSWTPADFAQHNSFPTKLLGKHGELSCSSCHNTPFTSWTNVNYRDGFTYGSCARCHTRNYDWGEKHHNGLPADADCGRCHGYGRFH